MEKRRWGMGRKGGVGLFPHPKDFLGGDTIGNCQDCGGEILTRSLYNANDRLKLYPTRFNTIQGDC